MTNEFDDWWNEDDLTTSGNNFVEGTPAYWAWEGWCAGVKAERDRILAVIGDNQCECRCAEVVRARGETK